MNNKGFTVVELLAAFALTMVIVVFLFEIILNLKEIYINNATKTKVMDTNSLIATNINKKLENKELDFAVCEINVCNLTYKDQTVDTIMINSQNIDVGDTLYEMPEGTEIIDPILDSVVTKDDISTDNAYLSINYKVKSKNLKKEIPFNYVYTFKHTN